MSEKEIEYIKNRINKISKEVSIVKCLSIILEEILVNDTGNLSMYDICTLCLVLRRNSVALREKMNKLETRLGI